VYLHSLLRLPAPLQILILGLLLSSEALAGGATLITHGFLHKVEDWVVPMGLAAARHPRRLHEFGPQGATVYVLRFNPDRTLRATHLTGPSPLENRSGDIILLLDWNPYSGDLDPFSPPGENTTVIGPIVAEQLLSPNLLPGFPGPITRLPLHLIGFSRGGSLVCEIAKRLGEHNVVVDHLTLIDPHASNNDGFWDPLPLFDGTVVSGIYENVLFADCVFQTHAFPIGSSALGAYVRSLTGWGLDGWGQYLLPHDNAHLWYHGTVEVAFPATSDGTASLTAETRSRWYAPVEDQGRRAGYYYSLRAGGDRREVFEPVDGLSGFPRLGLNQAWGEALGIPSGTNRTPIPDPLPEARPNLIEFNLAGLPIREEVPTQFPYGAPIRVAVDAPSSGQLVGRLVYLLRGSSNATLTVFLDGDENSFNGSGFKIQASLPPTGDLPAVVELDLGQLQNRAVPGFRWVGAVLESGGFARECYAPERLQSSDALGQDVPGSSFGSWSSNAPVTSALLAKYAIGGATDSAFAPEAQQFGTTNGRFWMSAVVRTDDPLLSIVGQVSDDLVSWTTVGVTDSPAADTTGVPEGWQRRVFSIDSTNNPSKQFLRLRAMLVP
jgi:hypothetical protein